MNDIKGGAVAAYFITFFITFLHPKYRINSVMTNQNGM